MGLADDEAANRAMAEAESNGWFKREKRRHSSRYIIHGIPPARSKNGFMTSGRISSVSMKKPKELPAPHGHWATETAASACG